jgi:hypothetical protein
LSAVDRRCERERGLSPSSRQRATCSFVAVTAIPTTRVVPGKPTARGSAQSRWLGVVLPDHHHELRFHSPNLLATEAECLAHLRERVDSAIAGEAESHAEQAWSRSLIWLSRRSALSVCESVVSTVTARSTWSAGATLSSVKTIAAWTLAILAVVGIGVGVEAAIGVVPPGTVTGSFKAVGGQAPGTAWGLEGTVYLYPVSASCGTPTHELCQPAAVGHSDNDGRFIITAPAGNYFLTGRSPQMEDGTLITDGSNYVLVTPGRTVRAELWVSVP